MGKTLIFGHKNPDTDTICSALAYADLKTKLGYRVEPVRLGEVSNETQYALDYFATEAPRLIEKVEDDVKDVILVDHNEFQQSVDNIQDVRIAEVIDHHRVANFETANPLYFRVEPVGCTATIINKMYKENKIDVSKRVAGLLLSAILSDLLLLKSPTCTEEDVEAAHELAEIAGVDMEAYGLAMLRAGADITGIPIATLLSMDAKEFTMAGENVVIAQVNTVDLASIYELQAEIETEIVQIIERENLELFLFVATDIIHNDSEVLALGNAVENVEKAFQTELANNRALLKGVVSRKKQIVTNLTNAFVK